MRKRPIGPVPSKPPGGATKKSSRRSVSIAPPSGGTQDRLPSLGAVKKAPAGGSASRRRGTRPDPGPSASGEGYVIAREGSEPLAETLRSVHESPVRRLPHARKKISARKLYPRERRRSSRSTLSRGHFCADRCWNSWHGDARAIAAMRKAILAPAKLTAFRRVNTPQTNARPVNLQRVAVDDARLAYQVIRARRHRRPITINAAINPILALVRSSVGHAALQDTSTRHLPPS